MQSARPSFPLVAFSYIITGFGSSLVIAQSDALLAVLRTNRHAKMMIGHGCFGLGALVAPLASTQFARYPKHWSFHYMISMGLSLVNTLTLTAVFRFKDEKGFQSFCPISSLVSQYH
jgi:MFS family permease